MLARDKPIYWSPRRRPGSSSSLLLDSGFRRNDIFAFDQRLLRLFDLQKIIDRHFEQFVDEGWYSLWPFDDL